MAGIFFPRGSQLRIPPGGITIRVTDDGRVEADPVTPQTRMDMWPQWLHEALDATVAAREVHDRLAAEVAAPTSDNLLGDLLDLELRASMRSMTSAAFAVDAFYASVQARSPEHPHRAKWREPGRRTPRHVRVFETLRYHLKVNRPAAGEVRHRLKQLFRYRDWAVHADAAWGDPVLRGDVDRGVDWHYVAFRAENATTSLNMTLDMLDLLIGRFDRAASQELRDWAPYARERLDGILDLYDAVAGLPPITRKGAS